MLYTEKEKNEIERVRKCLPSIQQSTVLNWFGLIRWAMSGWQLAKPGLY